MFYYGLLDTNDIETYQNDFNISHEFLFYDNDESDTYIPDKNKEILLYWFLNVYNKEKDANITNFVVTKGYVYNDDSLISNSDIEVNLIDINESLTLNIKRINTDIKFAIIHIIDLNASHLWYSKFNSEYNILKNSSCANHFCFTVTWDKNETANTDNRVVSGDTNGTKALIQPVKRKRLGVKIFRF